MIRNVFELGGRRSGLHMGAEADEQEEFSF